MNRLIPLYMEPGPDFVDALKRAWDAGDAVLPVDHRLSRTFRQSLVANLRIDQPVEPGDAVVVATSGTTGEPKGVVLTHEAIEASSRLTSDALAVTGDDHWLSVLPLAHIGGLSVVMRALHLGTALTVLPRFDADAVNNSDATLISVVPTVLPRFESGRFRKVLLGGAAPPAALPDNVVTTYGMTESASGVVYNRKALPGVELRTDDAGQVWLRSPTLLRAYRDGTDPKVDGWYPTGDSGRIEADGSLVVHGRISEMINTGGEKVWPVAVERVIDALPSVAGSRVLGVADSEWGEKVVVELELVAGEEPPTLESLREVISEAVAPYAAPKEIRVVTALERTPSGKLRRPSR